MTSHIESEKNKLQRKQRHQQLHNMFQNKHNPQQNKEEKKTALEPLAAYAVPHHFFRQV